MFKIFRGIRQDVLTRNRLGKYTIYAIGEIVLVVIGILIALQINNWNEVQKTLRWERNFLFDLKNEIENDYEQLSTVYRMQVEKGDACREVLHLIKTTSKGDKHVIDSAYARSQEGNMTFFPTTGVYNAAVSAGKIENVNNDSLKYRILNLYNRYYDRLVYNGEVLDDVVGMVDWENRKYYSEYDKAINSWEAINDNEFRAHLDYLIAQNGVYTRIAKQTLDQMEGLVNMIAEELMSKN